MEFSKWQRLMREINGCLPFLVKPYLISQCLQTINLLPTTLKNQMHHLNLSTFTGIDAMMLETTSDILLEINSRLCQQLWE